MAIRVTVWNEYYHEKADEKIRGVYPEGIHRAIAAFLGSDTELLVRTVTLDDPQCGLDEKTLDDTDVLMWWGHCRHEMVPDEAAARVQRHVLSGMGFIALHSAHDSKPFRLLMGTTCSLRWHEVGEKERLFVVEPSHPITGGLPPYFELPHEEMYGERFDIPAPDSLLMLGWFPTGEVFRSGCCWNRGLGKVFYFQPGHESNPTYYDPNVQTVLRNAVHWAAKPANLPCRKGSPEAAPLEKWNS